jgi:hypothetical protein
MNWKSWLFVVAAGVTAASQLAAQLDPGHVGIWHGVSAAMTAIGTWLGLSSPQVLGGPKS